MTHGKSAERSSSAFLQDLQSLKAYTKNDFHHVYESRISIEELSEDCLDEAVASTSRLQFLRGGGVAHEWYDDLVFQDKVRRINMRSSIG